METVDSTRSNAKSPNQTHGLIFFAHGSRDALWRAPVEAIAARALMLSPATQVRCAYLELTTPDLPWCVSDLVTKGVVAITVVPLFLGVGKHAREDLPVLMAAMQAQHPQVHFNLQRAIGEDDRLVDLIAKIALKHTPPDDDSASDRPLA